MFCASCTGQVEVRPVLRDGREYLLCWDCEPDEYDTRRKLPGTFSEGAVTGRSSAVNTRGELPRGDQF